MEVINVERSEKRKAILAIPIDVIASLLCIKGKRTIQIESDLPSDAELLRVCYRDETDSLLLIYKSESFNVVLEGQEIGHLDWGTVRAKVTAPLMKTLDGIKERALDL